MKVLIYESNVEQAFLLHQQLKELIIESKYTVDPEEAKLFIYQYRPDLLFIGADSGNIQDAMDIASFVHIHQRLLPFIVIGSEGEAEKMNQYKPFYPFAYLTKPLMSKSLFSTIRLAVQSNEANAPGHEELFLKTGTKYEKLDLRQLLYAKANGKYTELHFIFGKRLMRISLSKFVQEKINIELLRVHKSFAVNAEFISSYKSDEITIGENKIPIGRYFKDDVQNYLRQNTLLLSVPQK